LPDGHPFSGVVGTDWSSTTYAFDTGDAWAVDWFDGDVVYLGKGLAWGSWPVRGGQ
jgi:hypothetical protein